MAIESLKALALNKLRTTLCIFKLDDERTQDIVDLTSRADTNSVVDSQPRTSFVFSGPLQSTPLPRSAQRLPIALVEFGSLRMPLLRVQGSGSDAALQSQPRLCYYYAFILIKHPTTSTT
jgi:hypothetical protein